MLGEGGMGVVHLATQASLGRKVSVKIGRANPSNSAKLLREASITGSLEHPNVKSFGHLITAITVFIIWRPEAPAPDAKRATS